jgi:serine O-acetyltransferase
MKVIPVPAPQSALSDPREHQDPRGSTAYAHYVPALLDSYAKAGGLNHRESVNLPSKRAVAQICDDLLQILFPGFHDDDAISPETLPALTRTRLVSVAHRLEDQVRRGVRVGDPRKATGRTPPIIKQFLESIAGVREVLQTDVEAAFQGDPATLHREEILLSYPCIEAIAIQRLAHVLHAAGAPIVPRMMTEWAHSRTGIDIHPGASIGSHFFIDHGTGVVIGETCVIGSHVKLYHGVTLGSRSIAKDEAGAAIRSLKRHPNVEDHVTIYPNTTVLGGDTVIGARSTIGANVFILHGVPADSLVFYEEKQLVVRGKHARKRGPELDWSI